MSKYIDELTGTTFEYDPTTDVDEWIVCSLPRPGSASIAHSCHTDFRDAKLAQMRLLLDEDIDAWIEHFSAFGPPTVERQLDAMLLEGNNYA